MKYQNDNISPDWHVKLQQKIPIVFFGRLLPIFSLLVISVLYSRRLSYEDYGKFQTVWVLTNIVSTVLLFGLPSIIFATAEGLFRHFVLHYKKKILGGYALLIITAFLVIFFFTNDFIPTFKLLIFAFVIIQTACVIWDSLLIKQNVLKPYLVISGVYSLLFFLTHLYFYYHPFSLQSLILAITVLAICKLFFSLLALPRIASDAIIDKDFSPSLFFNNWLYTGLNEVLGVIVKWLDKIFLLYMLTAAQFAIFFNGSFEIPLFAVLISAIENVMLTNISKDLFNKTDAKNIFGESFKLLSLISFPIFFFFLFTHQETYSLIFDNKYNASIPVFLVTIFIIPLRITHYGVILQCYSKASKLALGSALDFVLSLALMFAFYPFLGTRGIMFAIVISTYLQVFYYLHESAKLLHITIWRLVPFGYLAKLFSALWAGYFILSFLKKIFLPTEYFATMFLATTAFIGLALYRYFFLSRRNIEIANQ